MTMATETKKYHLKITRENRFNLCYFTIVSTHSTCTKTANYPGTKLVGIRVFKLRMRMTISPSHTCVLHKTLNLVIPHHCFQRIRQRNVPKFKTHVQIDSFCSFNLLFYSVVIAVVIAVA